MKRVQAALVLAGDAGQGLAVGHVPDVLVLEVRPLAGGDPAAGLRGEGLRAAGVAALAEGSGELPHLGLAQAGEHQPHPVLPYWLAASAASAVRSSWRMTVSQHWPHATLPTRRRWVCSRASHSARALRAS